MHDTMIILNTQRNIFGFKNISKFSRDSGCFVETTNGNVFKLLTRSCHEHVYAIFSTQSKLGQLNNILKFRGNRPVSTKVRALKNQTDKLSTTEL